MDPVGAVIGILGLFFTIIGIIVTIVLAIPSIRNELIRWISGNSKRRNFPFETLSISELQNKVNTVLRDLPFMERPTNEKTAIAPTKSKRILVIGKPCAGKTYYALEEAKKVPNPVVFHIDTTFDTPTQYPKSVRSDEVILFLDDIPRMFQKENFKDILCDTIEFFERTCGNFTIIATARNTEFDKMDYPNSSLWKSFDVIEMLDLKEEDSKQLIEELSKYFNIEIEKEILDGLLSMRDGLFSNYVIFFKAKNEEKREEIKIYLDNQRKNGDHL